MRRDAERELYDEQRAGRVGASFTIDESRWRRFVNWLRGRKPYRPRTFDTIPPPKPPRRAA